MKTKKIYTSMTEWRRDHSLRKTKGGLWTFPGCDQELKSISREVAKRRREEVGREYFINLAGSN